MNEESDEIVGHMVHHREVLDNATVVGLRALRTLYEQTTFRRQRRKIKKGIKALTAAKNVLDTTLLTPAEIELSRRIIRDPVSGEITSESVTAPGQSDQTFGTDSVPEPGQPDLEQTPSEQ